VNIAKIVRPQLYIKQNGIALLVVMLVLVLTATFLLVNTLSARGIAQERDRKIAATMAIAKDALIAYAVSYSDTHSDQVPGYLPCPDTPAFGANPEGYAAPNCGAKNVTVAGKFPWRTLGIEPPRDGSGECLWYVVSGTFKNLTKTDVMNWDTLGQLEVIGPDDGTIISGAAPDTRAAAVIIAPGGPGLSQNRTASAGTPVCGGNYTPSSYLDQYQLTQAVTLNYSSGSQTLNAGTTIDNSATNTVVNPDVVNPAPLQPITRLIAAPTTSGDAFIDKLAVVSPSDIFNAVTRRSDFQTNIRRLASDITACLGTYGARNGSPVVDLADKRLVWAAPLAGTDYSDETWNSPSSPYNDNQFIHGYGGRLPYRVDNSKTDTANQMSGVFLLTTVNCSWSTWDASWYSNWKDQFFYFVGSDFSHVSSRPTACATHCLKVNGAGPYAAVLAFSGRRLAALSQVRNSNNDKGNVSNYLEGGNSAGYPNSGGSSNYQSGATTATFDDVLYCIDPSLNSSPCP